MPVLCLFYFYDIFQKIKYFYSATVFGNKKGKGEEGEGRGGGKGQRKGRKRKRRMGKEEKGGEKQKMKRWEQGKERGKKRGWREQGKGESVGVWCTNAQSRMKQHKPKYWKIYVSNEFPSTVSSVWHCAWQPAIKHKCSVKRRSGPLLLDTKCYRQIYRSNHSFLFSFVLRAT